MKALSMIFLLFFSALLFHESQLPKNTEGKIYFEEVVRVDKLNKEELYLNGIQFTSNIKLESKIFTQQNNHLFISLPEKDIIQKKGSFFVYKKGLFTPQLHGEITFTFTLEIMQNSYKYKFTDFVFHYYERNRHGRYASVAGKKKPLEAEEFAGMQKLWDSHKDTTGNIIEDLIWELKKSMKKVPADIQTTNKHPKSELPGKHI